jgi:hypothetical protein
VPEVTKDNGFFETIEFEIIIALPILKISAIDQRSQPLAINHRLLQNFFSVLGGQKTEDLGLKHTKPIASYQSVTPGTKPMV